MEKKFNIGCHLSSSDGYLAMGKQIIKMGGNTFQFFTRNPRGGKAKELDLDDINLYNQYAKENGIDFIVAHAPYTMNLCSDREDIREFALSLMKDDIMKLQHVNNVYYNFHPGSHVGQGVEQGIEYIANALNEVIFEGQNTMILLEAMAGKGSEIGRNFEELKAIIDKVENKDKIGVCIDTCHIHDGGYDIVNSIDVVLDEFDRIIGLDRLKAIHLNDSMNEIGSHKDRHQKIGQGKIGLDAIIKIINNPRLQSLPIILETPNELPGYEEEIKLLKERVVK